MPASVSCPTTGRATDAAAPRAACHSAGSSIPITSNGPVLRPLRTDLRLVSFRHWPNLDDRIDKPVSAVLNALVVLVVFRLFEKPPVGCATRPDADRNALPPPVCGLTEMTASADE
jgi:hypothetical protein